jgi:hypothetical protein
MGPLDKLTTFSRSEATETFTAGGDLKLYHPTMSLRKNPETFAVRVSMGA